MDDMLQASLMFAHCGPPTWTPTTSVSQPSYTSIPSSSLLSASRFLPFPFPHCSCGYRLQHIYVGCIFRCRCLAAFLVVLSCSTHAMGYWVPLLVDVIRQRGIFSQKCSNSIFKSFGCLCWLQLFDDIQVCSVREWHTLLHGRYTGPNISYNKVVLVYLSSAHAVQIQNAWGMFNIDQHVINLVSCFAGIEMLEFGTTNDHVLGRG